MYKAEIMSFFSFDKRINIVSFAKLGNLTNPAYSLHMSKQINHTNLVHANHVDHTGYANHVNHVDRTELYILKELGARES